MELQNRKPYELPLEPMSQDYEAYTEEHFEVWTTLYDAQLPILQCRATEKYFQGLELCGFEREKIPVIKEVNQRLKAATGWEVFIVPGLIDDKPFFEFLAAKKFPATTWLRSKEELEYLEEPDMFHDVFAHVPLLSIQPFVDFVQKMAEVTLRYIDNPKAVNLMSRLYWFTVEFGLIREHEGLKLYGAGIMSSSSESVFATEDQEVPRYDFDLAHIFDTPYYKHDFQKQYFVIDSYEQLYESMATMEEELNKALLRNA
ncbi:MAG: phenylalanine 4-monooxygenase [Bacteroidota bacterium]|nr:phenylalanine 4-monooxygenase [Bacteroidota bacterium]